MPLLSLYSFAGDFQGATSYTNQPTSGDFEYQLTTIGATRLLVAQRPDDEIPFALSEIFDSASAQATVDAQLGSQANRTSDIHAGWVAFRDAGYYSQDPNRHDPLHLLATLEFTFHIGTPDFCVDIDGSITYYIDFSLDGNGALQSFVDGWSYEFGGGTGIFGGDCGRNQANAQLQAAVPGGIPQLQASLDQWAAAAGILAAPIRNGRAAFRGLYLLPADADRSPSGTSDTGDNVALVLLPVLTLDRFLTKVLGSLTFVGAKLGKAHAAGHSISGTVPLAQGDVPFLFALAPTGEPARHAGLTLAGQQPQSAAAESPLGEDAQAPAAAATAPGRTTKAAAPAQRHRSRH